MKPRVLFNMPSQFRGRPSGVARMAFALLEHLIKIGGYDYVLRSPWPKEHLPDALQHGLAKVLVVRRPRFLILDVILQSLSLPRLCRQESIDLVVNVDPFGTATGGQARIMIVHDLYFKNLPDQFSAMVKLTNDLIYRLMLTGNREIISVSNATRSDLERFYPSPDRHVTTIHSAPLLRPDQGDTIPPVDGRYVLAVGNATENKNFRVLAEAMVVLHRSHPDVALVHVGDDRSEVIAHTLKLRNSSVPLFRFSGVDDQQLARLYRHGLCLCVPSLSEGFCLPILEAQICSCPVICSNRSAMPEIGGLGVMQFNPTDPMELAGCLKRLVDEPHEASRLRRLGHENVKRFSWDISARSYRAMFDRMLSGNASKMASTRSRPA